MTRKCLDFSETKILIDNFFPIEQPPQLEPRLLSHQRAEFFPGPRNRLGYRGDEFDDRGDFNIACLGCSWTEGAGVTRSEIFPDLIKETLKMKFGLDVKCWNLGVSGSGIDMMLRLAPIVVRSLQPNLVLLVMSGTDRREYFTELGERVTWNRNMRQALKIKRSTIDVQNLQKIKNAFEHLQNSPYDIAHTLSGFRALACMFDVAKIPWGYSWIDRPVADEAMRHLFLQGALPLESFIGSHFEQIDKSHDDSHPGRESHRRFADHVVEWIINEIGVGADYQDVSTNITSSPTQLSVYLKERIERWLAKPQNIEPSGEDIYPLW